VEDERKCLSVNCLGDSQGPGETRHADKCADAAARAAWYALRPEANGPPDDGLICRVAADALSVLAEARRAER